MGCRVSRSRLGGKVRTPGLFHNTWEDFLLLQDSLGEGTNRTWGHLSGSEATLAPATHPHRERASPPRWSHPPGTTPQPPHQQLTALLCPDRPPSVQSEYEAEPEAWRGGQATRHPPPTPCLSRACIPPPKYSDVRLEAQFEGTESFLNFSRKSPRSHHHPITLPFPLLTSGCAPRAGPRFPHTSDCQALCLWPLETLLPLEPPSTSVPTSAQKGLTCRRTGLAQPLSPGGGAETDPRKASLALWRVWPSLEGLRRPRHASFTAPDSPCQISPTTQ